MSEIIITADGSHTLRHTELGELYHSDRGAFGEACHVYIANGFDYFVETTQGSVEQVNVFEVGFGSGLNALLTLKRAEELNVKVNYHAIELYPIPVSVASELNYCELDARFMELHTAPWGTTNSISPIFTITKHNADLTSFDYAPLLHSINIIYFDAFAFQTQPELWSNQIFSLMHSLLLPGGILVTYAAKGIIKDNMRCAGFQIQRLPGALGKHHMVRASCSL